MKSRTESRNSFHLMMDIVWFGLAFSAYARYLSIYAIRLDASPMVIGLLTALPGLFLLFGTISAGWWRRQFRDSKAAIYIPTLLFRFVFLLPALAPLFPKSLQIPYLVISILIPSVFQGLGGTIFMVMMRETVSDTVMKRLWSQRIVVINIFLIISTLAFGYMLDASPFPQGYQFMFLIAFIFALMSMWHILRLKILFPIPVPPVSKWSDTRATMSQPRVIVVAVVLLMTYLTFFSVAAIVPLFLVKNLGATEEFVGWFGVAELIGGSLGAWQADRLTQRYGSRWVTSVFMVATAASTLLIALTTSLPLTLIGAALTGMTWTISSIAVFAFFLERTPAAEMQQGTVMFNVVIGVGQFVGSMIGSTLADGGMNLVTVLIIGAALRFLAGWLIMETRRSPVEAQPLPAPVPAVGD